MISLVKHCLPCFPCHWLNVIQILQKKVCCLQSVMCAFVVCHDNNDHVSCQTQLICNKAAQFCSLSDAPVSINIDSLSSICSSGEKNTLEICADSVPCLSHYNYTSSTCLVSRLCAPLISLPVCNLLICAALGTLWWSLLKQTACLCVHKVALC